jgi:hypothetical protein
MDASKPRTIRAPMAAQWGSDGGMATRYAIYYAPDPASALWRFGSAVIGYDAATGEDIEALRPDGFGADEWASATADPRRYGFHATLKAPFRLAPGRSESHLLGALADQASAMPPVDLGPCDVRVVPAASGGGFVAITPTAPPPALATLERSLVEGFEPWRAPPSPDEYRRRKPETLTERQRFLLDRYGYPYVLDEFRFHMTLTGRLDGPEPVAKSLRALAVEAGALAPILVDRLALFRQDGDARRFRVVAVERLAVGPAMVPPNFAE